jgi:hypothetical protein
VKKRNVIAILASLAVVLFAFAACNGNGNEDVTNPTILTDDGLIYEQVTEVVTDAAGEPVIGSDGETKVVTVTKLVTEPDQAVDAPTNAQGGTEGTTTYEDVTFPEGEKVEVEIDKDGRPEDCKLDKITKSTAKSKAFYINGMVVTSENFGIVDTGVTIKLYMKDSRVAMEMPMGVTTMRMAYDGKNVHLILPATKYYFSQPVEGGDTGVMDEALGMWDTIGSETMEYIETTNVKIKGNEYVCESYSDGQNINKYYFNKKDELKRIEFIAPDGTTSIFKVNECSSKVKDSIFEVPKGYKPLTEDALQGFMGSMGIS